MAEREPLKRWRRYLWLLPLTAGLSWFTTLAVLLFHWLAAGLPRLPLQSNPYVAFISDIGAQHLKPFFIAGCTITALSFLGTVVAVHYARYSALMYGMSDPRWRKAVSVLAVLSGLVACLALLLLSVFDTMRHHEIHGTFLSLCFGGLALSMISTTIVWFDQTWWPSDFQRLRRWCILSSVLVVVEVGLGVSFTVLAVEGQLRIAGILEWVITFLGAFYLSSFVGYLQGPETMIPAKEDDERQALLRNTSR